MPGPYSSQGSIDDALALVDHLAITHHFLPITSLYEKVLENLKTVFSNSSSSYVHEQSRSFQQKNKEQKQSVTEENLQARLRALTLMALSNKLGALQEAILKLHLRFRREEVCLDLFDWGAARHWELYEWSSKE